MSDGSYSTEILSICYIFLGCDTVHFHFGNNVQSISTAISILTGREVSVKGWNPFRSTSVNGITSQKMITLILAALRTSRYTCFPKERLTNVPNFNEILPGIWGC